MPPIRRHYFTIYRVVKTSHAGNLPIKYVKAKIHRGVTSNLWARVAMNSDDNYCPKSTWVLFSSYCILVYLNSPRWLEAHATQPWSILTHLHAITINSNSILFHPCQVIVNDLLIYYPNILHRRLLFSPLIFSFDGIRTRVRLPTLSLFGKVVIYLLI